MEEQFVNSIVGYHSFFRGDLELEGLVRIDGDFEGSIKTNGKVLIGSQGRADCTIEAKIVVIGGICKGNIYASEKIVLLSSSLVIGSVHTPRLIAEEGVILDGNLIVSGHSDTPDLATHDGHSTHRFFKRRTVQKLGQSDSIEDPKVRQSTRS